MSRWLANRIALLLAASSLLFSAIGIARSYTFVPFAYEWDGIIEFALNVRDGVIGAWWWPLKEHRPVLPRILYWIDFTQLGGNFIFLVAINLLLLASTWLVLLAFIRAKFDRKNLFFASCISCAVTFAWMQAANLYIGFNGSMWFMVTLFSLAAFYCLHRSAESLSWFIPAAVLGVASAWTMANGLFVLPIMTATSIALGLRWRETVALAVLSALCIAGFFWDFHLPANVNLAQQPMEIALFTLAFLGAPAFWSVFSWLIAVGHLWSVIVAGKGLISIGGSFQEYPAAVHAGLVAALVAGTIFLITAIAVGWRQLRAHRINSLRTGLLGFIAFTITTATVIAIGRSSLGVDWAILEQYQTTTLLGWQALAIVVIGPEFDLGGAAIIAVVLAVALFPSELRALKSYKVKHERMAIALRAAQQGSASQEQIKELGGDPLVVTRVLDHLRRARIHLIDEP
jgi:hypothetical protein